MCAEVDVSDSEDHGMFLPQMHWQTAHNYAAWSLESLEQPETDTPHAKTQSTNT